MSTERPPALRSASLIGLVLLGLLGCTRDAPRPALAHRIDAPEEHAHGQPSVFPIEPEVLPGVEVEVLAARLGGRGDAYLTFMVGREGKAEKMCALASFRPPDFVEAPQLGMPLRINGVDRPDAYARDFRADVRPLSPEESHALMRSVWDLIVVASTPEVFEAPAEFTRDDHEWTAPWRRLHPPVRLRVNLTWLERREESLFDGSWLILASPPPPEPERVVLNVVGWRMGPQRSRPLQVLLSRSVIPERQIDVQNHQGPRAQELIKTVRLHASDEVLPDAEKHPSEPMWTWFDMSRPLRVEVDGVWFRDLVARPDFERWTILDSGHRP